MRAVGPEHARDLYYIHIFGVPKPECLELFSGQSLAGTPPKVITFVALSNDFSQLVIGLFRQWRGCRGRFRPVTIDAFTPRDREDPRTKRPTIIELFDGLESAHKSFLGQFLGISPVSTEVQNEPEDPQFVAVD